MRVTLRQDMLQDGADYTPYEGLEIVGWPVASLVRGRKVMQSGNLVGSKGYGAYLERDRSPFATPPKRSN